MKNFPDPAEWLEGVTLNFKAGAVEAADVPSVVERIMGATMAEKSPPIGRGFTMFISAGQPLQLLGYDLTRHTARITASVTDIFIGERDQLAGSGLGAILPVGGSLEVTSTDAVYVQYSPMDANTNTVAVSVWVEKWAE